MACSHSRFRVREREAGCGFWTQPLSKCVDVQMYDEIVTYQRFLS